VEENKLIRQDKERRLGDLEQELIAAARGSKVELSVADIRKKGLLTLLREQTRRKL
jgi:hypothetical protein